MLIKIYSNYKDIKINYKICELQILFYMQGYIQNTDPKSETSKDKCLEDWEAYNYTKMLRSPLCFRDRPTPMKRPTIAYGCL